MKFQGSPVPMPVMRACTLNKLDLLHAEPRKTNSTRAESPVWHAVHGSHVKFHTNADPFPSKQQGTDWSINQKPAADKCPSCSSPLFMEM